MAIITISRQFGSRGDEIADTLAKKLDYVIVDKTELHQRVSDYATDFSKEFTTILNETKPVLLDRIFHHHSIYKNLLAALIYDCACKNRVIFLGRGSQILMRNQVTVLNVRFFAPLELRITRVQKEQNVSNAFAAEQVKSSDRRQGEFFRYLFKDRLDNPELYDIIINTARFETDNIVDLLATEAYNIDNASPFTEEVVDSFKILSLEHRVKVTLQKEMGEMNYFTIEAGNDGTITVSGYLTTENETERALRLVKSVPGVTSVVNRITIIRPQVSETFRGFF